MGFLCGAKGGGSFLPWPQGRMQCPTLAFKRASNLQPFRARISDPRGLKSTTPLHGDLPICHYNAGLRGPGATPLLENLVARTRRLSLPGPGALQELGCRDPAPRWPGAPWKNLPGANKQRLLLVVARDLSCYCGCHWLACSTCSQNAMPVMTAKQKRNFSSRRSSETLSTPQGQQAGDDIGEAQRVGNLAM